MPWNQNAFGNLNQSDIASAVQRSGGGQGGGGGGGSNWQLPSNQSRGNPYAGGNGNVYAGNPVNLSADAGFQNDVRRQVAAGNGMQKRAETLDAGGGFAPSGGGAGGGGGGAGGMMGGLAGMMGGGGGGGGGGMLAGKQDAAAGGGTTDKAQQLGNLWSVFGKIFGM